MQEKLSQISRKYRDKSYNFFDFPPTGKQVVYVPDYDSMVYLLYGDYYKNIKYSPGEIYTVTITEKKHSNANSVYVLENENVFSPAELVPIEFVDEADIKIVKEIYQAKLKEKIEKEKK